MNSFYPEIQIRDTESAIKNKVVDISTELKSFTFVATLVLEFKNIESNDETKYETFHMNSKAETNINENNIGNVFESIYATIISNTKKSLGKVSVWIIDSVTDHNINISKYNPFASSSYTKLPKELGHPGKGLINIQKY